MPPQGHRGQVVNRRFRPSRRPPRPVNWFPGVKPGSTFDFGWGQNTGPTAPDFFSPLANSGLGGDPGGGGGSGYADLIGSFLNQTRADFEADSAADASSRDAALRRLFISYGDTPDFDKLGISKDTRGFLDKAIDQKTRDLAAANTTEGTSIKARLDHENMLAQRRIPSALAARGILRSGQTGADLAEQGLAYKQRGFDTLNEMLSSAEGTVMNYLNAERARQRALAQAEMEAAWAAQNAWGDSGIGEDGTAPGQAGNLGMFLPPGFNAGPVLPNLGTGWKPWTGFPKPSSYPSRFRRSGNPMHRRRR